MARRKTATPIEAAADDASYAATEDEVREFLRAEAARDPAAVDRFRAARGRARTDHRPRISEIFDRAIEDSQGGDFDAESYGEMDIDLSPVLDEAGELERRGNPIEAGRLYRHISEVIDEYMPSFDEWEGEFRDIFHKCNREAERCARAGAAAARAAQLAVASEQDADACAEYLLHLRRAGDTRGARRAAADGARRFPDSKKVQSLSLSLCTKSGAEYRAALRRMFALTGSQGRLDELKRRSPSWPADRCELIRELGGRADLLAKVLYGEGMADELADVVLSARWPGCLPKRYHDALATPRHGGRLFDWYRKGAERALGAARGGDYREVGRCLRRMRGIPGQEGRFGRYAAGLRRRFGRRRALAAQLDGMGRAGAPGT